MEFLKENKIILVIGIIIVILLIWYMVSSSKQSSSDKLLSSSSPNSKVVDDRKLLKLLNNLKAVRLDGRIFESPAYLNLVDFSRDIVPEPIGREDPFAPVTDTAITVSGGEENENQVLLQQ